MASYFREVMNVRNLNFEQLVPGSWSHHYLLIQGEDTGTPLIKAARGGNTAIAGLLIAHGAKIEAVDRVR